METKYYYNYRYYDTFEDAFEVLKSHYAALNSEELQIMGACLIEEETRENDDFSPWGEDW